MKVSSMYSELRFKLYGRRWSALENDNNFYDTVRKPADALNEANVSVFKGQSGNELCTARINLSDHVRKNLDKFGITKLPKTSSYAHFNVILNKRERWM